MESQRAIVAVLAGGRGARLGGSKATIPLAGRALICHALDAASAAGLEAIVVAKPDSVLPPLPVPVVHEDDAVHHPLCGLLRALAFAAERSPGAGVVALACDMPFVPAALLAWLAELEPPAAVELGGEWQPLLGRYGPADAPVLADALRERRSVRSALSALGPRPISEAELARFGDPRRICFNVNDDEDLRAAHRLVAATP